VNSISIEVPVDLDRARADKVLATVLAVPRSQARELIDSGDATIDAMAMRASQKLSAGTRVDVVLQGGEVKLEPDHTVVFDVVYEDRELLVIDKPVGVVVHPGSGRSEGTLANGLLARYPDIEGVGQENRWGIVHRLDRDTSGLLVVALTDESYDALTGMLKRHEISRRYLTMVQGLFTNTKGTIDAPIGRDTSNRTRMQVATEGREAVTHYRRLASWTHREAALLSVALETGRTHQIRVHMRAIDHPIVGDGAYGTTGVKGDPGRPWLHARQLRFDHPITSEHVDIVAALPSDLRDSLGTLGVPDTGELADIDGATL
jgi:23S rRNA pseudouridine1911/1915/1917 synthase